jgi:uncharacterized protein YqjF (DUF2071 family)
MFSLKNHPFAVETFFKTSLVLTYAVPKDELKSLIPECLELDTFNDQWAFIAVALVDTKALRPKGFPAFMGNDFILIGFRVFVRYTTNEGKRLRGLYILKSETNKKKMSFWGNIFTHYNYSTTDIQLSNNGEKIIVSSAKSDLDIEVAINKDNVAIPAGSPFKDWKEARRFAGPLPFTFTYNSKTKDVLIIEGVREKWIPKPTEVVKSNIGFLNQKAFKSIVLANAFVIENIPYYWKKGKIEIWKG